MADSVYPQILLSTIYRAEVKESPSVKDRHSNRMAHLMQQGAAQINTPPARGAWAEPQPKSI